MAELLLAFRHDGATRTAEDRRRLWIAAAIGIFAFAFAVISIIGAGPETALRGFIGLLIGLPVYVWLQRKQPAAQSASDAKSD